MTRVSKGWSVSRKSPKPLSRHRINTLRLLRRVLYALVLFALAVALVALRRFDGPPAYIVLSLVAFFLLVIGGLWLLVSVIRLLARNPRILIYNAGLRYLTRQGEKRWRWRDFNRLTDGTREYRFLGVAWFTRGGYTLYVKDRKALSAGYEYQRARELGDLLTEKTAEALWPTYVAAYQRGRRVPFDKIVIDQDRIKQGKKVVDWTDVSAWEVRRGWLVLHRNEGNRAARFRIADVPNAHILLMFVESVMQYR